jgi:prepilin-type N-terminal cleavage/methylation domain-containing protein
MKKAFTLIEMITVLVIIIIVLAIAVPVWKALLGGTNLASAKNEISAFLSNARADAIFNRQSIGVCFYIDPKTQQTAMAEVQVQTLWQEHPYGGGAATYTSLFQPGTWTGPNSWAVWPAGYGGTSNGPINSLELLNNPDPNSPGNFVFYREPVLLPKGASVVLNNSTFGYNYEIEWDNNSSSTASWISNSPLDRYLRIGCIMFGPDGTLASIPFGIPYYQYFTSSQTNATYNLLCEKIGMQSFQDFASVVTPPTVAGVPTPPVPLISSPGLVIFDHDVYMNQHCSMSVMDNKSGSPTQTQIGDGAQFSDVDLGYTLTGATAPVVDGSQAQDKFIEEAWIDKNGTAFLVTPTSGSLIQAR